MLHFEKGAFLSQLDHGTHLDIRNATPSDSHVYDDLIKQCDVGSGTCCYPTYSFLFLCTRTHSLNDCIGCTECFKIDYDDDDDDDQR